MNRLLSKLALIDKMTHFYADSLQNFESMCKHMVEKFWRKDAKKGHFNDQMEFRKKSNRLLSKLQFMSKAVFFIGMPLLTLVGCGGSKEQKGSSLKVAATPAPHAQLLEYIRPQLEAEGIHLQIVVTNDYNMPNRALAEGEVDANFFQHEPFLEEQIRQFNYPLVVLTPVEIEPMGIYSYKYKSLEDLPSGAKIAIPNDPTNEGRALLLLQKSGLIELPSKNNLKATPLDITSNPKCLRFKEIDAAMIPRILQEVDAAAINTNYALVANLYPENALILEGKESPYVNVLVTTKKLDGTPELQVLKEKMTSPEMRAFILDEYKGAIEPAF